MTTMESKKKEHQQNKRGWKNSEEKATKSTQEENWCAKKVGLCVSLVKSNAAQQKNDDGN